MSEKIVEDLEKLIKHDKKAIKATKEKRLKFIEECNLVIKNGKERIRLNKSYSFSFFCSKPYFLLKYAIFPISSNR